MKVAEARSPERAEASERFLTLPRIGGLVVFILFALTFDVPELQDDGGVYFAFLRKLFGADTEAVAYQFGSAFWNAPFYLVSQLVAVRGDLGRQQAGVVGVTAASNVAVVVALYLGWRILKGLDLPRGPSVLLLTVFGTPLFFYGVARPTYKHAADTLYATAAFWFVYRSSRQDARRRDFIATGVCFALLLVTRYADVALVAGALGTLFVLRLRRAASWMLAATVATSLFLVGLPVIRHIPYRLPPSNVYAVQTPADDVPAGVSHATQRVAMGSNVIINPLLRSNGISVTAPVKMLFTLHRGLFVWTPLTALATLGFVLLLRRDRQNRPFLAALGVSALALLAIHAFWGATWDGGGSFSQRFLTALFPFFLVGTAEFVRRTRWIGIAVLTLCVAWSVWIGLVQLNGYYHQSSRDSVVEIVQNYIGAGAYNHPPPYHDTLQNFEYKTRVRISNRWKVYWRLIT